MAGSIHQERVSASPCRRVCLFLAPVVLAIAVTAGVLLATSAAAKTDAPVAGTSSGASTASTTAAAVEISPAPTTTETTVPAGPSVDYSQDELEFVRLLNEYRESKGLEPLLLSDTLTVACERHTSDMVAYDFVNHYTGYYRASSGRDLPLEGTRSDFFATGTDPAERMIACGYDYQTYMGENLAAGQPTAADALKALKASPSHNANLLSAEFKVIGIALAYDSGSEWGYYWTTDFGGYIDGTAHAVATVVASLN